MLEEDNNLDDATGDKAQNATPATTKRRRRPLDRMSIGVAALIALGGAGLYYMHARTAASIAIVSKADANAASVQTLLAGGREGLTALTRDIADTRETIESISERDSVALAAAQRLSRDPFAFGMLEATPLASQPSNVNLAAREAVRTRALESARKLQLQSIMYGTARRSCLIDGKLYFEGQPLGEFTIGRIATDAITIQTGEFKFELRLRK